MIALNRYTNDELITLMSDLSSASNRALMAADAKLNAWTPDLDGDLATLKRTSSAPVSDAPQDPPPEAPPTRRQLDVWVESAVRALRALFEAAINQALSIRDAARAARLGEVEAFVFDQGMGFLRGTYLAQSGSVERLVALARHETIAEAVSSLTLNGVTYAAIVDRIEANNNDLLDEVRPAPVDPRQPSPVTVHGARMASISTLNMIFDIMARSLTDRAPDSPYDKLHAMRRKLDAAVVLRNT